MQGEKSSRDEAGGRGAPCSQQQGDHGDAEQRGGAPRQPEDEFVELAGRRAGDPLPHRMAGFAGQSHGRVVGGFAVIPEGLADGCFPEF